MGPRAGTWQHSQSPHVGEPDTSCLWSKSGAKPSNFKPLPSVGPGAYEIRVRDDAGAFRVIYVAKIERAVYVLHAFQKTTRKTRQADIQLAARRYKAIGDEP